MNRHMQLKNCNTALTRYSHLGGPDFYPAFYVGAIVLAFTILIVSNTQVRSKLPSVYALLTGSRSGKPKSIHQTTSSAKVVPTPPSAEAIIPQRQR